MFSLLHLPLLWLYLRLSDHFVTYASLTKLKALWVQAHEWFSYHLSLVPSTVTCTNLQRNVCCRYKWTLSIQLLPANLPFFKSPSGPWCWNYHKDKQEEPLRCSPCEQCCSVPSNKEVNVLCSVPSLWATQTRGTKAIYHAVYHNTSRCSEQ